MSDCIHEVSDATTLSSIKVNKQTRTKLPNIKWGLILDNSSCSLSLDI